MQLHQLIKSLVPAAAVCLTKYIAKVTNVTHLIFWTSVRVLLRIVMWTSSRAALCQVTILVNVESMALSWHQSREGACDLSA